jgi:outer membrane protein assembly factor BamD
MSYRKLHLTAAALITVLTFLATSCSAPQVRETPPEEKLAQARTDIEKRRLEAAKEKLEGLKFITAGTRLGGEVQFLLAETLYRQGELAEAEVGYETYLLSYPGGPFAEKALFYQALSEIRQIEKIHLGFFSFKRYIPHDRDVSVLRDARVFFEQYLKSYPDGQWAGEAEERVTQLLTKEGEHELDIVSFYLRRKEHRAALARAQRVLENKFPEPILDRARELVLEAKEALPETESGDGS